MADKPEFVRFLAKDTLAQRQKAEQPRAQVTLTTHDGRPPVLRIYDVIDSWGGFWGISAEEVAQALDAVPEGTPLVEVHLNSPGGEAREGVAIANLFRQHPAKIVAIVDGLAASAASMVCMGADEVLMAPSSELMIHEASSGAYGDAAFLEQIARMLHHLSDSYAEAYAGKAGGEPAAWRELMLAETWYSPAEAVEAGLADGLLDASKATDDPAAAAAAHDLRAFAFAGRAHAPAPKSPATTSVSGSTEIPEESMSLTDAQVADLRTKLGITDENADGETILAAVDEALAEQSKTEPPAAAVVTPPEGTVLIDAEQLAALKASAAEGQQARAQQLADHREQLVTAAVADGRIAPSQKASWLAKLTAEGDSAEQVLASLAKGLVPVSEIGTDDNPELAALDAEYRALFGDEKVGG